MFELKIDVKVTLPSGAAIALSNEQERELKNKVTEIVLGKPDSTRLSSGSTKKTRTKKNKTFKQAWSKEEDEALYRIVNTYRFIPKGTKNRDRAYELSKFQREIGKTRTKSAILSRYCYLHNMHHGNSSGLLGN